MVAMKNPGDAIASFNLNLNGTAANTYDVIVIGSGISGGWASKEFCQKGLKILALERGRMVEHVKDYPAATMRPWEFAHRNTLTNKL
jgi:choline dehydrogenase-like flavoprotein